MEERKCYKKVYVGEFDDIIEQYRIYGDGIVIALIDVNAYVSYNYDDAKYCPNTQRVIEEFKEYLKINRKKFNYFLEY